MKIKLLIVVLSVAVLSCSEQPTELSRVNEQIDSLKSVKSDVDQQLDQLYDLQKELDSTIRKDKEYIVYTDKVTPKPFTSYVDVHGVVESNENVTIMAEASGRIQRIYMSEGDNVKAGQLLASIDTDVLNSNIDEVEKNLELARDLFEKQKRLREKNVGTEIDFLEAKNRKESLEQSLETLKSQKRQGNLRAPIDGSVEDVFYKTGEMASPGQPFARIVNTQNVYIDVDVSESYFNKIKKGDAVNVHFSYLQKDVAAVISYKGTYINPQNRTFKVHVKLPPSESILPPNLLAVVRLKDVHIQEALTVPSRVIQNDGHSNYLFVLKDGKATKRNVKTEEEYKGKVVIKEGLKPGDEVVVKGYSGLSDGVIVKKGS